MTRFLRYTRFVMISLAIAAASGCVIDADSDDGADRTMDGGGLDGEGEMMDDGVDNPGNQFVLNVVQIGNFFYPVNSFNCGDPEEIRDETESCPDGIGCLEKHYHGNDIGAIAQADDISIAGFLTEGTLTDSAPCQCGYGTITELPTTTITVFGADLDSYDEGNGTELIVDSVCE